MNYWTIIFSGIFTIAGFSSIMSGYKQFKKSSLIKNTPTSRIRSIAMGPVEIKGTVQPFNANLISPFTQKECIYWKVEIYEYKKTSEDSSDWVKIFEKENSSEFMLQDETGKVLVDPTGAEISLIKPSFETQKNIDKNKVIDYVNQLTKNAKSIIETPDSLGIDAAHPLSPWIIFAGQQRYKEWVIPQGKELFIIGNATENPYTLIGNFQKSEENVMIVKGNESFLISDSSENETVNRYFVSWMVSLIAGLIVICMGVYIILKNTF